MRLIRRFERLENNVSHRKDFLFLQPLCNESAEVVSIDVRL